MKLSELDKNKEYFIYTRDHWIDAGYRETYYENAKELSKYNRAKLKTDSEGNIIKSGSRVMVSSGARPEWVNLRHIRAPFFDAVEIITKSRRERRNRWNDRGIRYEEHLRRKADHERKRLEQPIKDAFRQSLNELGAGVWSESKVMNLPIEVMQTITEALKQYPKKEA